MARSATFPDPAGSSRGRGGKGVADSCPFATFPIGLHYGVLLRSRSLAATRDASRPARRFHCTDSFPDLCLCICAGPARPSHLLELLRFRPLGEPGVVCPACAVCLCATGQKHYLPDRRGYRTRVGVGNCPSLARAPFAWKGPGGGSSHTCLCHLPDR